MAPQSADRLICDQFEKHGLTNKDMYMVGSSMGGYAALYYGFWLDCAGVVVTNPQVDYQSTRRHSMQNWERKIREVGPNWVDLNDFIFRFNASPELYIEHGNYPADVAAVGKLVAAFDEQRLSYKRSFTSGGHSTTSMNRERLFRILNFWDACRSSSDNPLQ